MARIIIFLICGTILVYVMAGKLSNLAATPVNADSNFYFLDNIVEQLSLLTENNMEEKVEKILKYANEKIGEITDLSARNRSDLIVKVLPKHEEYINKALQEVEKIKKEAEKSGNPEEIAKVGQIETKIADAVLEKKEVLSEVYDSVPEENKGQVNEQIKIIKKVVEQIIQQVEGPIREIIVYKEARADEAIEDKEEEKEIKNEEEARDTLSDSEKLYYVWIESLYAKTTPKSNEQFYVRAHIRRRDSECLFFNGQFVVKIGNLEWRAEDINMQPSDDQWRDLGPITLGSGAYEIFGDLVDKKDGKIISSKKFTILVD